MKTIQFILATSLVGVLFSGYLTFTKLFSGSCPITEGCPYFLGYPSCLFGLLMFGLLLAGAYLYTRASTREELAKYLLIIQAVSGIGILFAGYFSFIELAFPSCLTPPCAYSLLLPTCVYGLIMYTIIFFLAWKMRRA